MRPLPPRCRRISRETRSCRSIPARSVITARSGSPDWVIESREKLKHYSRLSDLENADDASSGVQNPIGREVLGLKPHALFSSIYHLFGGSDLIITRCNARCAGSL